MIVFTTFPWVGFTPEDVLDWCRLRWQVELAFKLFKSIVRLATFRSATARVRGRGCTESFSRRF